ncbi:MAG TPA: ABC transporter permease [Oculatellaceae cyanobacterium]
MSIQQSITIHKKPTTVNEPTTGLSGLRLHELWQYRELLFFLVWRDIKVRYKQSVLGIIWIMIQPLVTMVVFTALFNQILGIGSDSEIPYPIFAYAALLPWTYFAGTLSRGTTSLVNDRNLISKVYFPRLVMPFSNVLAGLVDFSIAFVVFLGMMAFYNITPTLSILFLPLALLSAVITALGIVLWVSALNLQYRDFQYITPFLIQIWMYATPIIYPASRIPEKWQWLYNLNPMVGVVESFRWILLSDGSPTINWVSVILSLVLLVSGVIYFRQTERIFADVI